MKLWGGRFSKETAAGVDDFGASIRVDQRMYREDIAGSQAHARMLAAQGIISADDAEAIVAGLDGILADVESGKIEFTVENEDIHMNIEAALTERIGDAGKRLHTARSRNDQVALDTRLYLRRGCDEVTEALKSFVRAICEKAERETETVMPSYTHLQRAQPSTYAHYLSAYAEMFLRDISRIADCRRRMNLSPLGCGAVCGTTHPIDRYATAAALGFDGVCMNSMDGVSDRDFIVELASALAITAMHLSRFSEEMILWCSSEFGFIRLDDSYSTGSSIMPQKKNPDVAELTRGKTGRVYGDLVTILTVMKGLPLAYNKDMQEDKECVFDALDTVLACLEMFEGMLATAEPQRDAMRAAASKGFINATDCADYLVGKGVPFRDAYTAVGGLVKKCTAEGRTLEELSVDEFKAANAAFDEGVYDAIDLLNCVNLRTVVGGPAPQTVAKRIAEIKAAVA